MLDEDRDTPALDAITDQELGPENASYRRAWIAKQRAHPQGDAQAARARLAEARDASLEAGRQRRERDPSLSINVEMRPPPPAPVFDPSAHLDEYKQAYPEGPGETPAEVLRTHEHRESYRAPFAVEDAALDRDLRSLGTGVDIPRRVLAGWIGEGAANLDRVAAMSDEDFAAADAQTLARLREVWQGAFEGNLALLQEIAGHYPAARQWAVESGMVHNVAFLRELVEHLRKERHWRVAELSYARHGHRPA